MPLDTEDWHDGMMEEAAGEYEVQDLKITIFIMINFLKSIFMI